MGRTAFFGAYGSDVGRRWRGLCAAIERGALAGGVEITLDMAERTFASLDAWLAA